MALADDLSLLRLTPYTGPMGEFSVGMHVKAIRLSVVTGDRAWEWIEARPQDGRVRLPAGNYHVGRCMLAAEDKEGNTARGFAWMSQKPGGQRTVEANKTTSLVCDAPLVVDFAAKKTTGQSAGGRMTVGLDGGRIRLGPPPGGAGRESRPGVPHVEMTMKTISGAGGETYSPLEWHSIRKQGVVTGIVPRFRILDETGREIASGELKEVFSRSDLTLSSSRLIPKNLVGKKIRIVPELDLGPIETICKPLDFQL